MHPRKPSPALVVACLALFVALGGTAIAASHYVITSTSQIKPSVRSALAASGPYDNVNSAEETIQAGTVRGLLANCPTGEHVVTGGYSAELAPGWSLLIDNRNATKASKVQAEALCAPGQIATVGKTHG
jgi:hypothetical protein